MIYLRVKEYAALIGKSDKSVYKMIDKEKVAAKKAQKGYRVAVDEQLLKLIKKLHEEIEALHSEAAEAASQKTVTPSLNKEPAKKKTAKIPLKKSARKVLVKSSPSAKSKSKKKK